MEDHLDNLNFPGFEFKLRRKKETKEIFDPVRKKYVRLTPEEWVRQHMIRFLIEHLGCPAGLISVEAGTRFHTLKKRTDIMVYDRDGKIWMIVECKNPDIPISQEIFDQVALYNRSHGLQSRYLAITNGLDHYCCETREQAARYDFIEQFPLFFPEKEGLNKS